MDSPHLKKKDGEKKKKALKVGRKIADICEKDQFLKKLVVELRLCQDHLHRCHSQYSAFKEAREEAMTHPE